MVTPETVLTDAITVADVEPIERQAIATEAQSVHEQKVETVAEEAVEGEVCSIREFFHDVSPDAGEQDDALHHEAIAEPPAEVEPFGVEELSDPAELARQPIMDSPADDELATPVSNCCIPDFAALEMKYDEPPAGCSFSENSEPESHVDDTLVDDGCTWTETVKKELSPRADVKADTPLGDGFTWTSDSKKGASSLTAGEDAMLAGWNAVISHPPAPEASSLAATFDYGAPAREVSGADSADDLKAAREFEADLLAMEDATDSQEFVEGSVRFDDPESVDADDLTFPSHQGLARERIAQTFERLAARIRNGEIPLGHSASAGSESAVLASVLTTLLSRSE